MMKTKQSFSEQIKSPHWQKRRLEILQRDNFTCQICGGTESTLHVHHLHYDSKRKYWEYADWELITLCEECHLNEHSYMDSIIEQVKDMRRHGVTLFEIYGLLSVVDMCLHLGNEGAILDVTGDGVGFFRDNEISVLTDRRSKLKPKKELKPHEGEGDPF